MKAWFASAAFLLTTIAVGQSIPAGLLESTRSDNVGEKRAALRVLHNYRSEEVLTIARGVLDRETNIETGELAESLFLSAYKDLKARGELPAGSSYEVDAVLGRWLAETYIRPEAIPPNVRKNLLRSLAKAIQFPELTEADVMPPFVCGTGMPMRDSLYLLAKLDPPFVREMLLLPNSNKAVLLGAYSAYDPAGARELAPKFLNDRSAQVRSIALFTASRLKSPIDPAALQRLSKDPIPRLRFALLEMLYSYDSKVARPILTSMLNDKNEMLRHFARKALDQHDAPPLNPLQEE